MRDKKEQLTNDKIVDELKKLVPEMVTDYIERQNVFLFRLFKELRGLKRKNILNIISISEDELWNSVLPQVFQDKNKIQLLKKLYRENSEVIYNIDISILNEKYIYTLGKEKINVISCYPKFQNQILSLDDKKYQIFSNCLNYYLANNETDNWEEIATILLDNISSSDYEEFILNIKISEVDIDRLVKVFQNKNDYNLKNSSDLENYEVIKKKKLDRIIQNSEDIEEIKGAVLQKLFGQSIEYSKEIIKIFGEDIQNLHDCDEKDFVICLIEIMNLNSIDTLKEVYKNCDEIGLIDKTFMKDSLKEEYFREYKETLYTPSEKQKIVNNQIDTNNFLENEFEGLEVYNAGTDFCMLISSILSMENINYKQGWNRPKLDPNYFCTSYIRNDMLGIIGHGDIVYGFNNLQSDSLIKSGTTDIGSRSNIKDPTMWVTTEKYCTPNSQINQTEHYNEMDFYRKPKAQKQQPNYIVAFRKDKKVINYEKIIQAYSDWQGKLPIVIVDIDECLEKEKEEINKMLIQYDESKDINVGKSLFQKIKNNKNTILAHCKYDEPIRIDIEAIEQQLKPEEEIQRYFGINQKELEQILGVPINYNTRYDLAKLIAIRGKEILTSTQKQNSKTYQLYQESIEYISNKLAEEFVYNYEKLSKPEEYIDISSYVGQKQIKKIKNMYNNIMKEFERFGIDVNEMVQYINYSDNSKKIDESSVKKYFLGINYIEPSTTQNISDRNNLDKSQKLVTMSDLQENYNKVTPQEREQYINRMKTLKMKLKSIVAKGVEENESEQL